jgi:streptogramin lyase
MSTNQTNNWLAQVRGLFLGGAALASLTVLSACSGGASSGVSGISGAPAEVAANAAYVQANANVAGAKILRGKTKGGDQAVALSLLTLYAAGHSGAGSASVIGLGLSDQNGNVTAVYFCPSGNPQVYAVAQGGNAGGGYNSAIGLSAALGHCNSLPSSAVISEATTVASAYSLSQFLDASGQKPGASASNAAGLNNAVATFANLADLSSGLAQTALVSGATGTPPTATINTLANVLAPCVTSSGPSSSQCSALFGAATPVGGSAPTSTLQAALNIARSPGSNAATIFGLAGSSGPFQPALGVAPNDWTVALSYNGGSLSAPEGVAVDAAGNAWVGNFLSASTVNGGLGSVVRLSPAGVQSAPFTDNGHAQGPAALAVDANGTVWAANQRAHSGTASAFTASGTSLAGSPFALGGLANPAVVAVDRTGNVWLASGRQASVLRPNTGYAATLYTVPGGTLTAGVTGLVLDNAGNLWLSDANNNRVIELSGADPTQQIGGSPFSGGGLNEPVALALDAAGDVWAVNPAFSAGGSLTEFVFSSTGFTATNFSGNGLFSAAGEAIDGAGNVWVANNDINGVNGVAVVNASGAPLAGTPYTAGGALADLPVALAIDASGNVWVADNSAVVEIVGAAVPVKTPLLGLPTMP